MFFHKVEGHMLKLSSFGRGKNNRPKKSLSLYELVARSPSIVESVFIFISLKKVKVLAILK